MKNKQAGTEFWERLTAKVDFTPFCWLWTGAKTHDGYGNIGVGKYKRFAAHRITYQMFRGPIPEGLQLDHLCRVRHCVNPFHLEAVTCRENILRGEGVCARHARRTHCKHGHELAGDNLRVALDGERICRTCHREGNRKLAKRRWING
jgi:hypothetical protein